LRQTHRIQFTMLQGMLRTIVMDLNGPGEIVQVEGEHIVSWKVNEAAPQRSLEIQLNQDLTASSQFIIQSQTPLGEFPVRVDAMTLHPQGSSRNAGFLRIANAGSVSMEPTGLRGLNQISPDQFPGGVPPARQAFVYRFPSSQFAYSIEADRVQPEIHVSQIVVYQITDTDRILSADIELDIREAAIRDWPIRIPEDYSVVAVTGSSVQDYVAASEASEGSRELNILFSQEVLGRQLVSVRLEKNQVADAGAWQLPALRFPKAKSVQGDLGIVASPGFRAVVEKSELLVEKPLSYFAKQVPHLQHAFRIREPGWTATLQITPIDRSVQADSFHLYSLSQGTIYGSTLLNYTVTGSPVNEWKLTVPANLENLTVDGPEIRTWRRDGTDLTVTLQRPIMGAYTLLLTFEEKPNPTDGSFLAGVVTPLSVQSDRGYIQVVSPVQVDTRPIVVSSQLLALDGLELPAELRLLSTAPSLGAWQFTQRPFELRLGVQWFAPGVTSAQVVEFSEANSRVSKEGEIVTDLVYFVKSRGQRTLRLQLPSAPAKLWAVSINGAPTSARQAGDETLIPLPGEADPNVPIEVRLRFGTTAANDSQPSLELPIVYAPVLKTQWNLSADENYVLHPKESPLTLSSANAWTNGFDKMARHGFIALIAIVILVILASLIPNRSAQLLIHTCSVAVAAIAGYQAIQAYSSYPAIQLSLPVLEAGGHVELEVANLPWWLAFASIPGVAILATGLLLLIAWIVRCRWSIVLWASLGLMATGLLLQMHGDIGFWIMVVLAILALQWFPTAYWQIRSIASPQVGSEQGSTEEDRPKSPVPIAPLYFLFAAALALGGAGPSFALEPNQLFDEPDAFSSASSLMEQWEVSTRETRVSVKATFGIAATPGEQFLLLRAPAILTSFEGDGLRLSKWTLPTGELAYIATAPADGTDPPSDNKERKSYKVTITYRIDSIRPSDGIQVLTGGAATHQIELQYDNAEWAVECGQAANIEVLTLPAKDQKQAAVRILLAPGPAVIALKPPTRDLDAETPEFYVEGACLYTPGPGGVDGKLRLKVRSSKGRLRELHVSIPDGFVVSHTEGPISAWQFDPAAGRLHLSLSPTTPAQFELIVATQSSLEALPARIKVSPLKVEGASGQVGLLALAFGSDAHPEEVQAESLSEVSIGDFDASLIAQPETTLHRVFRYGQGEGSLTLQVSPVAPEVRAVTKQVISLSDERVVFATTLQVNISRTGVFQLSFPLPEGLEIETISGDSLHHWSELSVEGKRQIVLHLNSKTTGDHAFAISLSGNAPTLQAAGVAEPATWIIPRLHLNESSRQSGELILQPMTGLRLRVLNRQNATEADPRSLGATGQGALAFRLLQKEWNVEVGIEQLASWVTGNILHDVTLREGQTRSVIYADIQVQNAAIRSLRVQVPLMNDEDAKTLRVHGDAVNELVRSDDDATTWEIKLKRRVIGPLRLQMEFERRGDRSSNQETIHPIQFPDLQQTAYYGSVRVSGRLEVDAAGPMADWQPGDWNTVPQILRESGNRNAPALLFKSTAPTRPIELRVVRHSITEALKLRVASGKITTILSPTGDQLTTMEATLEVVQRSSLIVKLPAEAEILSIFVNGESVHSIRQDGISNAWQFYILPGIDDRTAQVRIAYTSPGASIDKLRIVSPELNLPLENIEWNVVAPLGYELTHADGNLERVGQYHFGKYDRSSYLETLQGARQAQAQQATQLLQQANDLLQSGQRSKAQWALNNVANRYALDAASNEDARVQLGNIQTQQAVVGLNSRRQRLLLDNTTSDGLTNDQQLQAAAANPILHQEQVNYRPQEFGQLLAGNSKEMNDALQQIASRLVLHQRVTDPAPQALMIQLPEEGNTITFRRSVQVKENAPLELNLQFHPQDRLQIWEWITIGGLLCVLFLGIQRSYRLPRKS
jgi:hypothetical protein